jgi:hypothetical protein
MTATPKIIKIPESINSRCPAAATEPMTREVLRNQTDPGKRIRGVWLESAKISL